MAHTFTAFLLRDHIPMRAALQTAIHALGFKLTLEDDYVPFASSGYLPCTLDGEDAGLNIRFVSSDAIAGRDAAIVLQSGGDPREEATVVMIAAALANTFDAVIRDSSNSERNTEGLITSAKEAFAELD
jgi:hypothetical protein